MKKQTKVLVAAAMLTLGASFSSMAALKNGTWILEDGTWQYADKNGELVDTTWAMSNGTEFFIDEEGYLGSSRWFEDDNGHMYYVQSDGSKTVNAWKYIFADGEEDDAEVESESWFWFDSKGRMAKAKTLDINGQTYYFGHDGKMLTGWVDTSAFKSLDGEAASATKNVVRTNEDGAVIKSAWINEAPWTMLAIDAYDDDFEYYWAGSNGKLVTGKQTAGAYDLTYFFDNDGQQLTGWILNTGSGYENVPDTGINSGDEVYYGGSNGNAKKNTWRYIASPEKAAIDDSSYWYWFDNLGKLFTATDANAYTSVEFIDFEDGEKGLFDVSKTWSVVNTRKVNGELFYFNEDGKMASGLVDVAGVGRIYLNDGVRYTGVVTLPDNNENDYEFAFGAETKDGYDKYVAITGQYNKKLYENGLIVKSTDNDMYLQKSLVIDGAKKFFLVDENGKVATSGGKYDVLGKTEEVAYEVNRKADGAAKYNVMLKTSTGTATPSDI